MIRALVLTGTIDTSVFNNTNVKLTDTQLRLKQYEDAISFYIEETKMDYIIFGENSGYDFNIEKFETLALNNKKKFEFIPITTDYEMTVKLGKSYGEGDCIEQTVIRSRLLKEVEFFYKVTGRVIVKNIDSLLDNDNESRCIFRNDLNRCYTVFFKMNKQMFLNYFLGCKYRCDETQDIDIETVFYQIITENKLKVLGYKHYPKYEGIIGTIGCSYGDSENVWKIKDICTKVGLFSVTGNGKILNIIAKIRVWQAKRNGER